MDIRTGCGYPASALSNFAPHPFVIDGVRCASMEGFLQSLKFQNPNMQEYVCTLVGVQAKYKGKKKAWWKSQQLHWKGKTFQRDSDEYQQLLDHAYAALAKNRGFKAALLATHDADISHSIGKSDITRTVITEQEFCSRLMRIRGELRAAK